MNDALKKLKRLKANLLKANDRGLGFSSKADLITLMDQLDTAIKKIPQDKTDEILNYIKDSNSQLDDLMNYAFENIGCQVGTPSSALLKKYNREPIDKCSLIFYILEQYFEIKKQ